MCRPSARIWPFPNTGSSVGNAFIVSTTLGAIGRVLRLRDGFDEVCGRAVHAGMHVVRVFTLRMRGRKALCKIARRIVRIPIERLDRLHALRRGFQPKRRHVLEVEH